MGIIKSFDINNLLPFRKPGKGVPKSIGGEDERIAELDPNLSPEEQVYVGHYVGYADILLGAPAPEEEPMEEDRVIELRAPTHSKPREAKRADGENQAA